MSKHEPGDRIVLDPRLNPLYHAYFVEGFRALGHRIAIADAPFPPVSSHRLGLRAVVDSGGVKRKLWFEADDFAMIEPEALAWADVYGAVNLMTDHARGAGKVVALGPSFGVRAWGPRASAELALRTARRGRERRSLRAHLSLYVSQMRKRLPIDRYVPGRSDPGFVFFTGWLWSKHPEVNPPRARFVRAARDVLGAGFEGGFAPRRRNDVEGFDDVTNDRYVPLPDYLEKTKRSACVFSAPAVHGCLGWKLGEFLALGKAIIAIQPDRALPAPLEHGVHVHWVEDDQAAMRDAVERICADHDYRATLEQGARRWFDQWSSPSAAVGRMLDSAMEVS